MVGIHSSHNTENNSAEQGHLNFPDEQAPKMTETTNRVKEDIVHNVVAQQPLYVKEFWSTSKINDLLHLDVIKDTNVLYRDVRNNLVHVWAEKHISKEIPYDDKIYRIITNLNEMVTEYCSYADFDTNHAFDMAIKLKPVWLKTSAVPYYKNLLGKLFRIAHKKKLDKGFIELTNDPEEEMRTTQRVNKELKEILGKDKVAMTGNPSNEELRDYIQAIKEERRVKTDSKKAA